MPNSFQSFKEKTTGKAQKSMHHHPKALSHALGFISMSFTFLLNLLDGFV